MSNQQKIITGLTFFPNKPTFSAISTSSQTNATGDGTDVTVIFNTELIDRTNSYNPATGVYTADKTGQHLFTFRADLRSLGGGHTSGVTTLVTSNRTYFSDRGNYGAMRDASNIYGITNMVIADMDAGDTASVVVTVSNSTKTVQVFGLGDGDGRTFFQGWYLG